MGRAMRRVEGWTAATVLAVLVVTSLALPWVLTIRMWRWEQRMTAVEGILRDPTQIGRAVQHQQTQAMIRDLQDSVDRHCPVPEIQGGP